MKNKEYTKVESSGHIKRYARGDFSRNIFSCVLCETKTKLLKLRKNDLAEKNNFTRR